MSGEEDRQRKRAFQLPQRRRHRVFRVHPPFKRGAQQMHHRFGIGLGLETPPRSDQTVA